MGKNKIRIDDEWELVVLAIWVAVQSVGLSGCAREIVVFANDSLSTLLAS